MDLATLKKLIQNRENEVIELKQWRDHFSFWGEEKFENRKCLYGYCVAIGNEGGGYLLMGVDDSGCIVGTASVISNAQKKKIYDKTGQKLDVEEVFDEAGKRVLVVSIPSRGVGKLLRYAGVPLMRVGDALEVMSEIEEKRILSEGDEDFSARICTAASMEDLDPEALTRLRSFYSSKNGENTSMERASDEQFLSDVSLMRGGGLTYAAVVLLAKKEFLDLHLADAEICFEYRNKASDLPSNERRDYRKPFVLLVDEIWEKIASRQQVHPIIEGFLRRDIPAFNQEVFREALFNAVCHRDYTVHGSIFIKQSPDYIEITNPGGFPAGVTKENIIKAPSTPRNRLLAETFQRVFRGVERSGQGADKIFRLSIEEGKGLPDYSESTAHHVILRLPAMLKDENFIKYLEKISNEKQITLSLDDMLLLEKIREGVKEGVTLKTVKHLLDQGLIELYGRTRSAQYLLSHRFYIQSGKLGEHTKKIGLPRAKNKELILEHIRRNGKGNVAEFRQIFPELSATDIANLVQDLRKSGLIERVGEKRWSFWKLKK